MSGDHPDDQALLDELRRMFERMDTVPEQVTSFAELAYGLRSLDADLAELVRDSANPREDLAGVRSSGSASRTLSFDAGTINIDVEVATTHSGFSAIGQVAPALEAATVSIENVDGAEIASSACDPSGRFRLDFEAVGQMRFRVNAAESGVALRTEWFRL